METESSSSFIRSIATAALTVGWSKLTPNLCQNSYGVLPSNDILQACPPVNTSLNSLATSSGRRRSRSSCWHMYLWLFIFFFSHFPIEHRHSSIKLETYSWVMDSAAISFDWLLSSTSSFLPCSLLLYCCGSFYAYFWVFYLSAFFCSSSLSSIYPVFFSSGTSTRFHPSAGSAI